MAPSWMFLSYWWLCQRSSSSCSKCRGSSGVSLNTQNEQAKRKKERKVIIELSPRHIWKVLLPLEDFSAAVRKVGHMADYCFGRLKWTTTARKKSFTVSRIKHLHVGLPEFGWVASTNDSTSVWALRVQSDCVAYLSFKWQDPIDLSFWSFFAPC